MSALPANPRELCPRAVIYARYSSDLQRFASIEDQHRVCREWIEKQGWPVGAVYTDRAVSGTDLMRPGYQTLIEDARLGKFEVVVAEALDRLSRDQEHVAALFKHLSFAGVQLITLAEGPITELHVGLKGTMNALALKDLAAKTHRGIRGRIEAGRSGGGGSYGYELVVEHDSRGERVRGGRVINQAEASVVQRVFWDFIAGKSPRRIAAELNRAGIPCPSGSAWGSSTIHGNWRRGTGILNNELYIGRSIWNRQRFVKDPATGKRVAKPNPETAWIVREVPELRIIDQDTWDAAKARQSRASRATRPDCDGQQIWHARRPKHLFSGLVRCAACCGPMVMVGGDLYGCANRKNKGTCDNPLTMRREVLERSVLSGLKTHLLAPELVKEFIAEFQRETNRLNAQRGQRSKTAQIELARVGAEIRNIISAVKQGMLHASMREALSELEEKKTALEREIAATPAPPPVIHPNLAELYRRKVDRLHECLNEQETRGEAAEALRSIIDEIRLVPQDRALAIDLYGELGAIIALTNDKAASGQARSGRSTLLVAGARNHRELTLPV